MMGNAARRVLGVIIIGGAIAVNVWLVFYVRTGSMAAQHSTNCMDKPMAELAAMVVYLSIAISALAAIWFFDRIGSRAVDLWDRLLWLGMALAFVPVTTMFFGAVGFIFGPPGWSIGALLGGSVPFLVLERVL